MPPWVQCLNCLGALWSNLNEGLHPPSCLAGDFIDEDTQQVHTLGNGSAGLLGLPAGAAAAGDAPPAVTNASWRMYKWMRDYAALMR